MILVETKRLVLRRFQMFDAAALEHILGDPEVMRFGPGVRSPQWIHEWLRDCLEMYYGKLGFGPWAVVEKGSGSLIGYTGLFYFPDIAGQSEIEIGYRFARDFWGQGFAAEAALAVRDLSFGRLGLSRLIALIDPLNVASIRVAKKGGHVFRARGDARRLRSSGPCLFDFKRNRGRRSDFPRSPPARPALKKVPAASLRGAG